MLTITQARTYSQKFTNATSNLMNGKYTLTDLVIASYGFGSYPALVPDQTYAKIPSPASQFDADINRGIAYVNDLIKPQNGVHPQETGLKTDQVGLFGTCGTSTWRLGVIDSLNKEGITSFNPQVPTWTMECIAIEAFHKKNDEYLMFVITKDTTSVASMVEVAYLIGCKRQGLILVIEDVPSGVIEGLDEATRETINKTRAELRQLAKDASIDECKDVASATERVISIIKSTEGGGSERGSDASNSNVVDPCSRNGVFGIFGFC